MYDKISDDFKVKIQKVKELLANEETTQEKLDYFISEHNLQDILAKFMSVPEPATVKFEPKISRHDSKALKQ